MAYPALGLKVYRLTLDCTGALKVVRQALCMHACMDGGVLHARIEGPACVNAWRAAQFGGWAHGPASFS